jgi:hypothetical protein
MSKLSQNRICYEKLKKFRNFYVPYPEYLDVKTCGRGGKTSGILNIVFFTVVKDQLHAVAALPRGRVSGTHSARRWVDLRSDLDVVVKITFSFQNNPVRPSRRQCSYY